MAEQVRKEKQESAPQEEVEEVAAKDLTNEELDASVEETLASIDQALEDDLADIDEILGEIENAELFVAQFINKGGE